MSRPVFSLDLATTHCFPCFVSRRRLWALILLVFCTGTTLNQVSAGPRSCDLAAAAINEMTWTKIKVGMSRREVRDLIGGACGNYNSSPVLTKGDLGLWGETVIRRFRPDIWTGDHGEIIVCFDENGLVQYSFYRFVVVDDGPLIERFLSHWLWRGP